MARKKAKKSKKKLGLKAMKKTKGGITFKRGYFREAKPGRADLRERGTKR